MKKFVKNVASNIGGCLLRKGKQIVRNSRALVTVVMALARMKKLPNPISKAETMLGTVVCSSGRPA